MTNDFYNITTNEGEALEVYLTDAGFQSLDGSGRAFDISDCLYISKFDEHGNLQVYSEHLGKRVNV